MPAGRVDWCSRIRWRRNEMVNFCQGELQLLMLSEFSRQCLSLMVT